jgi:ribosomal protein S18 acetylase RimI-like enzyme
MPVVCRPARAEDLERSDALVVASINDLTQRHGFGAMASSRPPAFQLFSLKDDPDGLWVAEDGDELLGFAWSWACEDFWFLAQLFVQPGQQGRGIGNALIERTLEHAEKVGAANRALITFSFNTVSQGLYIRHGLFPRFPIYFFGGPRERVAGDLEGVTLRHEPLQDAEPRLADLARIDRAALGVSREKHHRYLLGSGTARGFALHADGACVGYAYVSEEGHVGPLAVADPQYIGDAFRTALKLAAESGSAGISAFIPGTCDEALRIATGRGMRITFPLVLMSARDPGAWKTYLPRNPGHM